MKPILYDSTETAFVANGIGKLSDAINCFVTEERNGEYELTMQYPIDGQYFDSISQRGIILAKPNPTSNPQPFRVYRITKPLNGIVSVYAEHISYDLSGIPVSAFTAGSVQVALSALKTNSLITNPFTFWSDKTTAAEMETTNPYSCRSLLGGQEGSVLDIYGGEYEFDFYTVKLHNARGSNGGVSIRYGKNLTSLEQDENCSNVYTGILPYWTNSETTITGSIVNASGTYNFSRIKILDTSSDFTEQPEVSDLTSAAEQYISANNIGVPNVNLNISFEQLEQTEEYKGQALLERVDLCDTVNVVFPALGVSATAKCIKTVYDVLLERYDSVELGDAKSNLATTISDQARKIEDIPTTTALQAAIAAATELITGNKGGYVVFHSTTNSKQPDEILIMDQPTIAAATKVWRWNESGLGYSSNGYNGPFELAMTINGAINASLITVGALNAALITAGVLQGGPITDEHGNVLSYTTTLDLAGGLFKTINGEFSGYVNAIAGVLGCVVSSSTEASVNGDLTVTGNLVVNGSYPSLKVTPGNAGITSGSTYLVTSPSADNFGTMQVSTLDVVAGSSRCTLLLQGNYNGGDPGSGSGSSKYSIIRFTNTAATIYIHANPTSGSILGQMSVNQWYVYSSCQGNWYYVESTCTYSNGSVSNVSGLSVKGWVNLDATLNTVDVYLQVPAA